MKEVKVSFTEAKQVAALMRDEAAKLRAYADGTNPIDASPSELAGFRKASDDLFTLANRFD